MPALPEDPRNQDNLFSTSEVRAETSHYRERSTTSLRSLWQVVLRHHRMVLGIEGGLLLVCLLYCLIAPNEYEARARVELRTAPASPLSFDSAGTVAPASLPSAQVALETMAGVLRGDQLAWRTIRTLKLYQAPGFCGDFARRFPGFRAEAPSPAAQAWLLERFARRLHVQTMPRTLLVQIRFRSRDAALSAAVVNELIRAYNEQDSEAQALAMAQASGWLGMQLKDLKARVDADQDRLAAFERKHGIVEATDTAVDGASSETEHNAALLEIDELLRFYSRFVLVTVISNRSRHGSARNLARTFLALWRSAASSKISTGKRRQKTRGSSNAFAAMRKRRRTANGWCVRASTRPPTTA